MIIVLAALQLTSNDVHSRLTRNISKVLKPPLRPGVTTTVPLETMEFADNRGVLSGVSGISSINMNIPDPKSALSSVSGTNVSFVKDNTGGLV